jgi:hypothetical protein
MHINAVYYLSKYYKKFKTYNKHFNSFNLTYYFKKYNEFGVVFQSFVGIIN